MESGFRKHCTFKSQMLYKVVVHTVLLYGSESWVVTGVMLKVLEWLHRRSARSITEIAAWHVEDGEWEYPAVKDVMESSGL